MPSEAHLIKLMVTSLQDVCIKQFGANRDDPRVRVVCYHHVTSRSATACDHSFDALYRFSYDVSLDRTTRPSMSVPADKRRGHVYRLDQRTESRPCLVVILSQYGIR